MVTALHQEESQSPLASLLNSSSLCLRSKIQARNPKIRIIKANKATAVQNCHEKMFCNNLMMGANCSFFTAIAKFVMKKGWVNSILVNRSAVTVSGFMEMSTSLFWTAFSKEHRSGYCLYSNFTCKSEATRSQRKKLSPSTEPSNTVSLMTR